MTHVCRGWNFQSKNRTPVEETLAKASVKLEEVAASMVQETPMEEDQFYKQFCSTEGDDQFYQQGLLTEMKIDDKMNLPKHVGRTKLIAAPTSGKAVRPQSLTQDMVEDKSDHGLEKPSEPPDIEEMMERVLLKNEERTRAVILEEIQSRIRMFEDGQKQQCHSKRTHIWIIMKTRMAM